MLLLPDPEMGTHRAGREGRVRNIRRRHKPFPEGFSCFLRHQATLSGFSPPLCSTQVLWFGWQRVAGE